MATKSGSRGGRGGNKQSGNKTSKIAGKVLSTGKATKKETMALAASVLSQDETKGKR
jgi:hypothetical protein